MILHKDDDIPFYPDWIYSDASLGSIYSTGWWTCTQEFLIFRGRTDTGEETTAAWSKMSSEKRWSYMPVKTDAELDIWIMEQLL